ncbi:MAG: hypothetical protein GQ557_01185 [Mycoplasmataceae bacterium]|nr:hypothetical protein [Mycoplasmataceae bacterium]
MADLEKIKKTRKNKLGDYLTDTEQVENVLEAPEVAPVNPKNNIRKSREKTGRTEPFGTRVSKEFLETFKQVSFEMKLKKVELLEESLKAYIKNNNL